MAETQRLARTATVVVGHAAGFFFLASAPLRVIWPISAVVGGVWLGILGEWGSIVIGFGAVVVAPFLLSGLLLAIGAPLLSLMVEADEVGDRTLFWISLVLSQLLTYAVVSAWLWAVFLFFLWSPAQGAFWPLVTWSYAAAMGPWEYLMAKDRDESVMTANFTNSTAAVACIAAGLWFVLINGSIAAMAAVFGAIMLFGLTVQTLHAGLSSQQ